MEVLFQTALIVSTQQLQMQVQEPISQRTLLSITHLEEFIINTHSTESLMILMVHSQILELTHGQSQHSSTFWITPTALMLSLLSTTVFDVETQCKLEESQSMEQILGTNSEFKTSQLWILGRLQQSSLTQLSLIKSQMLLVIHTGIKEQNKIQKITGLSLSLQDLPTDLNGRTIWISTKLRSISAFGGTPQT